MAGKVAEDAGSSPAQRVDPEMSESQFAEDLLASGLMTADQLQNFQSELPAAEAAHDAATLAESLVPRSANRLSGRSPGQRPDDRIGAGQLRRA